VVVTGVGANLMNTLNGAWTHTWQGVETKFNSKDKKTIYQSIREKVGEANCIYSEGTSYDKDINTKETVKRAIQADYIVVCLGELPSTEKPGDIDDLTFDRAQLNLVKELSKTGKPIIVVLNESR